MLPEGLYMKSSIVAGSTVSFWILCPLPAPALRSRPLRSISMSRRRLPCCFNWPITLPIGSAPLSRKSIVYAFNRKYALKLGQYIEENHFDAIVMPHLFPAEAITYLKKKRNLSVRTYAVATDYTCIPFWEETQPDYFFIPHRELSREFIRSGIPREKLVPLGIPVQRTFLVFDEIKKRPVKLWGCLQKAV